MNCEPIRGLFSAHLEGELDPRSRRRVSEHLGRCAGCRQLHAEVDRLLVDLPHLAEPVP